MAAPDPFPGEGGPGAPEAGRSGLACDGPAITHGGPGPPRGGRVRSGYPRALPPTWVCRDPGPHGARGRVRRPRSQLLGPEAVCHVAQRRGGAWIMRSLIPGHPSGRYPYLYVPTGTIAAPLHGLTKNGVPFQWGPAQQQAFDALKSMLTHAPLLQLPDFEKTFELECDTSEIGIGGVLIQGRLLLLSSACTSPTVRIQ
jgi:hypothetical protein